MSRPLLILGLGNDLMADDGAGLEVVRRLRGFDLPPGVRADEAGSDVLRLADRWRGEAEVWLVDAMWTGAPPGAVRVFDHDQVLAIAQTHATAHQLSLPESLRWLILTYPEMAVIRFRLWGIEAARVETVEALSPAVREAVDAVAASILDELRR